MKAWAHRDAKGRLSAVVATDDAEKGELMLDLPGGSVVEIDAAGLDNPRDPDQMSKLMATLKS